MIVQRSLLVVLFNLFAATSVDSFSISTPSFRASTCLRAEEESAGEAEAAPAGGSAAGDDILSSPAFLKKKLDVLKNDIAQIDTEIEEGKKVVEAAKAEWGPQLDGLQSEYKNIQERMSSQNKVQDVAATQAVVRDMLEVMDNMDRAFGSIKAESDAEKEIEAEYKEAYQMIVDTFEKLDVKQVETIGKEFDYEVHQAVMQRPSDEYEEGIVCEELQKGFIIGDTLIRAAMVSVAA